MPHTLHLGDCLDILRTLPDNSVDAVVTDPPYGLSFMGKKWDYDVPSEEIWSECLRVLKPGGHLLAFAGTRTQHRMAVRIEDAGFEIRDMIAWVYGSGFPKSLDVGKAIDKRGGASVAFDEFRDAIRDAMRRNGVTRSQVQRALGNHMLSHYLTAGSQPAVPVLRDYLVIRDTVGLGHGFDHLFNAEAEREVVTERTMTQGGGASLQIRMGERREVEANITAPATDAARQWQGWGTALKPALEPITVARKPLIGTVAQNVLTWGTGGVNVDGCRVGTEGAGAGAGAGARVYGSGLNGTFATPVPGLGRWPANLIHDGSEEVVGLFPVTTQASWRKPQDDRAYPDAVFPQAHNARERGERGHNDTGSAARFFYCAKASKADRGAANAHPTVKPTDLMRYLCRLVTPPGGVVLDPFMGSGSTGKAAILEGFNFIGIEREPEYLEIARARITHAQETKESKLL